MKGVRNVAVDGLKRRVALPFADVVDGVKAALRAEGFGVLTEIDVRATMQEKLGVEFRDYVILGACNPQLAHRALLEDLEVGTLLPCNVAIYRDGTETVISAFDPEAGMALASNGALAPIVGEAKERLLRAVNSVGM